MSDMMIVVVLGTVALLFTALWSWNRDWKQCEKCSSWLTKTHWKSSGADTGRPNMHHYYASYHCYSCGSETMYLHTTEHNREDVMYDRW
jgi:hypothetical protein